MSKFSPPPSPHFIDYDDLMYTLRLALVRDVLDLAAKNGLPGNHCFQFTVKTSDPSTEIPDYLRQRYPEEIVLVLQHRFEQLETNKHGFAVTLYFQGHPERIFIPWTAVLIFQDPSVPFGLQIKPSNYIPTIKERDSTLDSALITKNLPPPPTDLSSFSKATSAPKSDTKVDKVKIEKAKVDRADKGRVITLDSHRISKQSSERDNNQPPPDKHT